MINKLRTLFLIATGFGTFMGCIALMTWDGWYTVLGFVSLFGSWYCIDYCDEYFRNKSENSEKIENSEKTEDRPIITIDDMKIFIYVLLFFMFCFYEFFIR